MDEPRSPFETVAKTHNERRDMKLHPFIKGLYLLFTLGEYAVYTNDTYSSGVIEHIDYCNWWIRYAQVKGCERRFAFDSPERVPSDVLNRLQVEILERAGLEV